MHVQRLEHSLSSPRKSAADAATNALLAPQHDETLKYSSKLTMTHNLPLTAILCVKDTKAMECVVEPAV